MIGNDTFKMNYDQFHGSAGADLHEFKEGDIYFEFGNISTATTKRYKDASITTEYEDNQAEHAVGKSQYKVNITEKIRNEIEFMLWDISG